MILCCGMSSRLQVCNGYKYKYKYKYKYNIYHEIKKL